MDQFRLFFLVNLEEAASGRRHTGTRGVEHLVLRTQIGLQPVLDGIPGALILRFFLTPDHYLGIGIGLDRFLVVFPRELIQLFYANNGDVVEHLLGTGLEQVVVNLAGAENNA